MKATGEGMEVPAGDLAAVGEAAREVIREAKAAGVYVFGGGINEDVAPLMVASDGSVTNETYPETKDFDGGFCSAARRSSASLGMTPKADDLDAGPFYHGTKADLRAMGRGLPRMSDWARQTPEQLQTWREKLARVKADSKAEIIN